MSQENNAPQPDPERRRIYNDEELRALSDHLITLLEACRQVLLSTDRVSETRMEEEFGFKDIDDAEQAFFRVLPIDISGVDLRDLKLEFHTYKSLCLRNASYELVQAKQRDIVRKVITLLPVA